MQRHFPVLGDVFDTQGGLNDPKQKVAPGGSRFTARSGSPTGSSSARSPPIARTAAHTPIDFDALPARRCRRSGDLPEPPVQPGIPAGRRQGAAAGRRRLLLSRTPAPSTCSTSGSTPPARCSASGFTAVDARRRRHQDLGGVRRFHLRFHAAVERVARRPLHQRQAPRERVPAEPDSGGAPELGGSPASASARLSAR